MADCRKRGAPSGSVPSSRPRQRSRPSSDREEMLQRMKAAAVIVLTRLSGEEIESSEDSDDSIDVVGKVSDARSGGSSGIAADKGERKMDSAGPPLEAAVASAPVMSTLQRSISRNRSKPYSRWPVSLLQMACSLRGIAGQSKQKDGEKMVVFLENYDKLLDRPSPYLADLEDRAAGGTAASNPPAGAEEANTPPYELVTAVRAASNAGASVDPNKMYDFDGKSYAAESILAVIGAEDAEAGVDSTTSGRRKSKHCVPRATELMVDGRWRDRLARSRTPLSKAELDNKETGEKRDVHLDLWESFKDENVKVVNSLEDDPLIISAGIDPNIVHQPGISFDNFMNMLKEVNKEFGSHDHNFKKSGSHEQWWSFSQENLDSYYYGVVMRNHPEIRAVCDQLLPVDVQRENTDMGGADAKRREAANHQAREDKGKGKMNSAGPSLQAAVASAARMSTLQKSIFRNRSKPYSRWPACLLQTACSLRGITGQSKQKDGEKMAVLLENYDKAFERPSPYVADLENRAAGGTAASNPPAGAEEANTPPYELVTAVRAASNAGASIDPNKMYDFDGKSYAAESILAVIGAEDAEAGVDSTTSGRRKSKHCVPRATELMVDDRWRDRLARSRTQLSKAELDNSKETGEKRDVHLDLWESFKDENVKVVNSLGDDPLIISAGIDPNVVHQPDISFGNFMNMLNEVNKEFGNHDHNFKKSGSHDQWWSFSQENLDSYYYGVVMRNHPEIRTVCDQLLPVDVQRENTGMGEADAKRREAANRKTREDKDERKMNSAGPSLQAAVASAPVMSALQKSISRNRSKSYFRWPVCLLQMACSMRGITGQSKQRNFEKMAVLLENCDKAFERPSPYVADLEDRAGGGTAASNPTAGAEEANTPPYELVTAIQAAYNAGASIDPNKMYDFDGKSYAAGSILAVIGAEDAEAGVDSTTSGRRKSKHCVPRATELMVDDRWRERLARSRTQLSKAELDNSKEAGGKRDVHLDLWENFKDENVKVVNSLGDDPLIISAGIDPNVVHQPDISFDNFMNMLKEVNKEFGNHDHNFKKSGSHDRWWSSCQENLDSYYYGVVMRNHPEIRAAVCDQLLPVDVQRESTGMGGAAAIEGGAEAAAADAKRREAAKRKAREDNTHLIKTAKRGRKSGNDLEEAAYVTLQAVSKELGLPSGGLSEMFQYGAAAEPARKQAPPSSRESIDSKVAKIKYTETLFEAYFRAKEELDRALREARPNGDDINSDKIFWLETRVQKLKVEMEAWKAEAL